MASRQPNPDPHFGGRGSGLNTWARRARGAGWTVVRQRNGHFRWMDPNGRLVLRTPGSPSQSSLHFAIVKLRKAGL
jgi:hypothetical protein